VIKSKIINKNYYREDFNSYFYLIISLFCLLVFIFTPYIGAILAAAFLGLRGVPPGRLDVTSIFFFLTMFLGVSFTMASRIPSLGISDDVYNYWLHYSASFQGNNSDALEFELPTIEPGVTMLFQLFSGFLGDLKFEEFRFICTFLTVGLYAICLIRITREIKSKIFRGLFLSFGFMLISPVLPMQLIRQHIASIIIILGTVNPIFKKRIIIYFVAFFFHYSTIFIVAIYELARKFGLKFFIPLAVALIFFNALFLNYLPENYSYILNRQNLGDEINKGALNYILLVLFFSSLGLVTARRRVGALQNLENLGGIYVIISFLAVFYSFYEYSNLSMRSTYLYSSLLLGPALACFTSTTTGIERLLVIVSISFLQVYMVVANSESSILWHYWEAYDFIPFYFVYEMLSIMQEV
jgi:hypothetical protein